MRTQFVVLVAVAVLALPGARILAAQQHPAGGAHQHPEAAKVTNPVASDAASIAAGKQVYEKNCASCHGKTGAGDGMMGEELTPKPANFTTGEWKHGSSDGEIFAVIKSGVKGTGMKSFNSKLTEHQMWDVVNYLRTLAPAKSH